jgi:RNA polymerase sigma-70 factor (ECF subfamily)
MAGRNSAVTAPPARAGAEANASASASVAPPFTDVYRDYFDFVWASVRRLGVTTEALDDVVQEVFIVIHARLHTLQQSESLRSWIYGVVRRTVSTYHRSRKVKLASGEKFSLLTESRGSPQQTPYDLTEQSAQLELLSSLLGELDPAKREVFMLAELEEMTVPEIAQALEIPLNTAYSRLRAARLAFDAALARRAAREREKG